MLKPGADGIDGGVLPRDAGFEPGAESAEPLALGSGNGFFERAHRGCVAGNQGSARHGGAPVWLDRDRVIPWSGFPV